MLTSNRSRLREAPAAIAAMFATVTAVTVLPFLRFREFYLAGDSISQWLPVSRRMGDLLLQGQSHLMDPTMWRGGNFVAEARFGVWNPLALALNMTVLQLDDLALIMLIVSLVYLAIAAGGVYLLAREYGASAWPAALAGASVTAGGWLLWFDAAWWTPHLASFAFTPFVWVAARRMARGVSGPIWTVVAGLLCMSVGNPYSNVVIVVIVVAVAVEFGDTSWRTPLWALGGALVAIGLAALFVYLPFRETSVVGFRGSSLANDENWSPGAGDFLVMSAPTATPFVRNFNRAVLDFPAFYVSWFVLPLAPWLRWRTLWRRELAGLAVVGGGMFVLALGPSELWFFRWPIRMLPYVYLPLLVALSLLLSASLAVDRWRRRATATALIVLSGGYLSWADVPIDLNWHLLAAAVVLVASGLTIATAMRRPGAVVPVMLAATILVLGLQLAWKPLNETHRHYDQPTSASTYVDRFAGTSTSNLVQIAAFNRIPPPERYPDGAYRHLALGSTLAIADVESVSMYSGIGFNTHDAALCIVFDGSMCADAWNRLWAPTEPNGAPLADLLAADTVVVQRTLVDTADAEFPVGWLRDDVNDTTVVWRRAEAPAALNGRVVDVVGPVVVEVNRAESHRETVKFRRTDQGPAELTFARLAWPGYEATIDGEPLLVGGGPAGLLTVTVPPRHDDGEIVVTWRPPYFRPSLGLVALAALVSIAGQLAWRRAIGRTNEPQPNGVSSEPPA